ncbi:unnamed protein product, partial [Polarella glacialis]
ELPAARRVCEWTKPRGQSEVAASQKAPNQADANYRTDRQHGLGIQYHLGPYADGLLRAAVHPNLLHVGRSASRIGAVDWPEVLRLALAVDAGAALPSVRACFETGNSSEPLRLLDDMDSLSAAYAALLTDEVLEVCYYTSSVAGNCFDSPDAERTDVYCPRLGEAASLADGPFGVMSSRLSLPAGTKREGAMLHPECMKALGRKMKPHWPKAWSYAKSLMNGDVLPPVAVHWNLTTHDWRFKDGCHRYFAAHISGSLLRVTFSLPKSCEVADAVAASEDGDPDA